VRSRSGNGNAGGPLSGRLAQELPGLALDLQEIFSRFALALGIGLLIGLERGWTSRADAPGSRTAGIRTFALAGMLGGLFGALSHRLGEIGAGLLIGLGFAAFAATFAAFCRDENRADKTFSATTMVAGLTAFALGAYALVGEVYLAAAGGVAVAGILVLRGGLHAWVARITEVELRAGLVLLAMTFIALPLLPDRSIGPFGGVNPQRIWLIAIVLAAVSFVGYAAVRAAGQRRGVLIAAAAGGLVSSTAVTISNARRAAAGEGDPRLLAAGASLATAVSLVRTVALIAALNLDVMAITVAPLLVGAAVMAGAASLLAFGQLREEADGARFGFRNPFELTSVLLLALFLAAILMGSQVLHAYFGAAGAIAMAVFAGIADTDGIAVSMSRLAPAQLPVSLAGWAVLAAVASNTLSKWAIGVLWGGARFAAPLTIVTLAALAAAAAAFLAVG
jgi:uncharacterized membrane protein (DUF4010 family)